MADLARALEIAHEAHAGQVDKAGRPYIEHVLRVVEAVQTPAEKVVAALHDVVEDGDGWNLTRLAAEGFSMPVVVAVGDLTRPKGLSYTDHIRNVGGRALARAVKIADLRDNSDPARLALLPEKDRARLSRKYAAALEALGAPSYPTPPGGRAYG